jgi:hypothetical protein
MVSMSLPSPKEFYEQFKNDPEAAQNTARKMGQELSQIFLCKLGIRGDGLETVAEVLNEFQRTVQGDPNAKVEGDKVTMHCSGFCPVMRAALTLKLPWAWLDSNFAWPMIQGIASYIIPDIKLRVPSTKNRGDPACIYIFER